MLVPRPGSPSADPIDHHMGMSKTTRTSALVLTLCRMAHLPILAGSGRRRSDGVPLIPREDGRAIGQRIQRWPYGAVKMPR
jgi:hypothetical protein